MNDNKKNFEPLVVVLDGGAHAGAVHPGFVSYLKENQVHISTIAGISIGSLVSAGLCNGITEEGMRNFFLEQFGNGYVRATRPPFRSPQRMMLGGVVDQVPVMRKLVDELGWTRRENHRPIAFDLLTRQPYVFEGEYDLATALAASCSPYPLFRPVKYRDTVGKLHFLVDACAYLAHKRIFEERTIIARIFNVGLRRAQKDETGVLIGYPNTKVIRRLSPTEYEQYWQHGHRSAAEKLSSLLAQGQLPVLGEPLKR